MKNIVFLAVLILYGCANKPYDLTDIDTSTESIALGTGITVKGQDVKLYDAKIPLTLGDNFVSKMQEIGFDFNFENQVTIINVVPSIDTRVCEAQTHILGEDKRIDARIKRITISRDLPMAQQRFAEAAKLTNITYYSDYKNGNFGRSFGIMMQGKELLARGVIVLDAQGIIKHMQFVPEATRLPDMLTAFETANALF